MEEIDGAWSIQPRIGCGLLRVTTETFSKNDKARIHFTHYIHTSSRRCLLLRCLDVARLCLTEVDDIPDGIEVLYEKDQKTR